MADEEPGTPAQAIQAIRNALLKVEEQYPDSISVRRLHTLLEKGLKAHGHHFGFDDNEIIALAGGGTPKLPPPPPEG